MAGRKPLTLTDSDYFELLRHIRQLPFKRKCEQKLTDLFEDEEKSSLTSFSADDYEVLKKCRYEQNAFNKRQILLQLILATDPSKRTTLESKVALLRNQGQIDAYFAMHDTLDLLLRKNRTAAAEKIAVKKADMALNPKIEKDERKDERKQRDSENYFLGAYVKKLLESSNVSPNSPLIRRLAIIFDAAEPAKRTRYFDLYNEANSDPRNPFN